MDTPRDKAEDVSHVCGSSGTAYLRKGNIPGREMMREQKWGGAAGAGAEIPLQPVDKTMEKQIVPLQPMEDPML